MTDNEFLLKDRLQKIKQIINKYGEENFYISFSGGKDSTVLSALVDMAVPENKIPRVYANTGIELNMIRDFVFEKQKQDERIIVIKPTVPIKKMLEEEGYPFKSKQHSKIVDIYNSHGMDCITVPKYLGERDGYGTRCSCPKILRYQFTDEFKEHLKISDKCCLRMKEEPLDRWAKENNKSCRILGIMPSEGGRRSTAKCLAFRNNGKVLSFHPLVPVTKAWEEWLISEYNIEICDIYKPPYNFNRTGCKGCPFALNIQNELDTLEKYFPAERKQCEIIWKPVYDEYRRIGYRLKKKGYKEMKNELVTITGAEISFNNKQLNTATKNIYDYVFGMEKNKFKMAAEMSRILENNLFVDDFENFETYASKVFNLKKAMAYNYAAIGKEWIERNEKGNPTGESILPHDTVDYQITKILALMKVGVEQATEWANDGTITPFMSVKEIKDIVKEWDDKKNTIDVDATETPEQETETETETESDSGNTEQVAENKPFNVTELLSRISNQINEYNKNGKTEQIETLKWVVEQVQEILK